MEMDQVRYFLSVARTLNFTRAAEECDVAQPSLSRAIKQLEAELGGELFRRERPQAILTELGHRMLPILTRCYESANTATALAGAVKKGEAGALRVALSSTIDLEILLAQIQEVSKIFDGTQRCRAARKRGRDFGIPQGGDAEVAIAGAKDEDEQSLERFPLFDEGFLLSCGRTHRLANSASLSSPIFARTARPCAAQRACRSARGLVAEGEGQTRTLSRGLFGWRFEQARGRRGRRRDRAAKFPTPRSVSRYPSTGSICGAPSIYSASPGGRVRPPRRR